MNDDLISRSDVLKILHDFGNRFEPFSEDADAFADLFIHIRDMESSYIDKVVQELEEHAIEFEAFGQCSDYIELSHAVEIVKRGGLNDT